MTAPRTLLSYLALPRPGDLVKMLILPTGFLVGVVGRGAPGSHDLLRGLLVWLCLELLVYQARYQWNDIRGFVADQRHPDGDRGRLPGPIEKRRSRVLSSGSVAVAKVGVAIAACAAMDLSSALLMGMLTLGVFGIAGCYELLRSANTGRSEEIPAPVTAGVAAIWVTIGAGYALRAVTGLGLAVGLSEPTALLPAAIVTSWAFGTAWITSRWAVEATAFADRAADGRLTWVSAAGQAKEHQLALVRWLPSRADVEPSRWRAVREATPWHAPWNLVGALAGGAAAATGVLLAAPATSVVGVLTAAVAGIAGSSLALAAGRRRAAGTLAGLGILFVALATAQDVPPMRAAAPWIAVSVAQVCYLRQDRASLGNLLRRARGAEDPLRRTGPLHCGRRPAPTS